MAPPLPIPNREVKHVSAHDTRSQSAVGKIGQGRRTQEQKERILSQFLMSTIHL